MSERYAGLAVTPHAGFAAMVIVWLEHGQDEETSAKVVAMKRWVELDYSDLIRETLTLYERYRWRMLGLDQIAMGEAVLEAYRRKGVPVEGVPLTTQVKHNMVQLLVMLLQQRRIHLPRVGAEELKAQIAEQERVYSNSGVIRYQHPDQRSDEWFWALCMALHVARRAFMAGIADYRLTGIKGK